ncbi:invasion associated locus B family protein [Aliiroseovarius sp. PrR006]|uniref:invasion associated locus B family protein n=1 Tax=Aliiroseovarius sp. PrR006 TaxID=2706883 RepID=UPI0013D59938|nr:invasion associated locus B family protein [Aliiroseovarius sp. PrR006]NDW52138.1 invasion associated locus B family protein [Aliiroseovarius sp. PrR006]
MNIELIKSLSLVAALSIGTAATAQENSDATTDEAPATQPAVDLGEPVNSTRQPGQTYIEKVTGDWERKCIALPEGQGDDPCQMYQLLKDNTGNAVAEISLGKLPEGTQAVAGATVVVPLETLLTQQLTISVDGTQGRRYPFRFCTQLGCVANIGFTNDEIAGFKAGANAMISIVPAAAPDQRVNLTMSLAGFTASFDELSVPAPRPAPAAQ